MSLYTVCKEMSSFLDDSKKFQCNEFSSFLDES